MDDDYHPQMPRHAKDEQYKSLEERFVLDIYYWDSFKIHQGTSLFTKSTITLNPQDYEVVGEYRDQLLYEKKPLVLQQRRRTP